MKGRTASTLSRTKYVKYFRVETSCYRLVLRLKFVMTVELLYDQAEIDLVQCQTQMRAFAFRICSKFKQIELNWNRIAHQNASRSLVFSTTRPWNKQISAPVPSQLTSEDKYKVFSLHPREDWLIDLKYSSVNFKWTEVFLCCRSFDRRGQWIFLKNIGHAGYRLNQRALLRYGWELRWIEQGCVWRPTSQEMK